MVMIEPKPQTTIVVFLLFIVINLSSAVYLEKNAYKEILVSFSPSISQKDIDLVKLQIIFRKASQYLFHATKRRAYFSEFVVSLPSSFDKTICDGFEYDSAYPQSSKVSIYVQDSSPARTKHSRGCGKRGEVILIPMEWMDRDQDADKNARELVQKWATYRYGVFDETPIYDGSCFSSDGETWRPTGCYNVNSNASMITNADGIPTCKFFDEINITSSIMYDTDAEHVRHFCDGSKLYPHNPLAETYHNILCNRKPVWSIIKSTDDFKYGRNAPMDETFVPTATLKCLQEQPPSLYILLQNGSAIDITTIVTEIRYSLLRFLLYSASPASKVTLVTFSNETHTAENSPVTLELTNREEAKTILKENIRVTNQVSYICLTCGLNKMNKILNSNADPNSIVIIILFVTTLDKTNSRDLLYELDKVKTRIHFLVIEDEIATSISKEVIDKIYDTGGSIHRQPIHPTLLNTKLNLALINTLKNPLHMEDNVIILYENTFPKVLSDIEDDFSVDGKVQGDLVYTLKCNDADRLYTTNSGCTDVEDLKNSGYQCGMIESLKPSNESKSWTFKFKYLSGIKKLTCSSFATLHIPEGQKNPITFQGWISHHEVSRPGETDVIIYAELLRNFQHIPEAAVEAIIIRPESSETEPYALELRDSGNGDPDIRKGDGIYSRYFSAFTTQGSYSVSIVAKLSSLAFTDAEGIVNNSPVYRRIVSVGSFIVTVDPPKMDIYPPNRIADLKLVATNHETNTITLQWTAPGDDYDSGQALKYEIKQSNSWVSLTEEGFTTEARYIEPTDGTITPSISGITEKHVFNIPLLDRNTIFYLAIQSLDKQTNPSEISNIIQVLAPKQEISTSSVHTESSILTDSTDAETTNATDFDITSTNNSSATDIDLTTLPDGTTMDETTTEETVKTDCPDKHHIIVLASSIGGGILVLLIIINIVFCLVCSKRKKGQRKMSRKDSMLPPHNMDIVYKEPQTEQMPTESADELIEKDNGQEDSNRYAYLAQSLTRPSTSNSNIRNRSPVTNDYEEYRNGFELATAFPAYVTAQQYENPNLLNASTFKYTNSPRPSRNENVEDYDEAVDDTQIYHLGLV